MPDPQEMLYPTKKDHVEDRRKDAGHRKLLDEFFDHPTLMTISRLITQGQFESLDYPISTGKEGGVFRASLPGGFRAVKVYRIGNTMFRHLPPSVLEELLKEASAHNRSQLIFAWTRREHTILRKMAGVGIRCPQPYGYLRNVLVMELVGTDGIASAPLQESVVADPARLYQELIVEIRRMVVDARLVHGDLSPYNVLLHDGHPVLIDVAQSISAQHPQSRELLERDVRNFAKYFIKQGVETSTEQMLAEVGASEVWKEEAG
ncbi:MAG: serine protein kinase RIO [Thermoplasmata archaeon]|nr:serine protein kinase RIO [Thermoplasmata archaeon]MCI4358991.1 serine protein kinase RIO [Thermoplasmata archaeon]